MRKEVIENLLLTGYIEDKRDSAISRHLTTWICEWLADRAFERWLKNYKKQTLQRSTDYETLGRAMTTVNEQTKTRFYYFKFNFVITVALLVRKKTNGNYICGFVHYFETSCNFVFWKQITETQTGINTTIYHSSSTYTKYPKKWKRNLCCQLVTSRKIRDTYRGNNLNQLAVIAIKYFC